MVWDVTNIRSCSLLFVRNIPEGFGQEKCDSEFGKFPGFVSYRSLEKGRDSGLIRFKTVDEATEAMKQLNESVLKVSFMGSTACDTCKKVVNVWINCCCKGTTYCSPKCMLEDHQKGHAAVCKPPPTECKCLEGRKWPGVIICLCRKVTWCSVACMEKIMAEHGKVCVPRRFISRARLRQIVRRRKFSKVPELRTELTALKKKMAALDLAHKKQVADLKVEIAKLGGQVGGVVNLEGGVNVKRAPTPPVALSLSLTNGNGILNGH